MVRSTAAAADSRMYHRDGVGLLDKLLPSDETVVSMGLFAATSI